MNPEQTATLTEKQIDDLRQAVLSLEALDYDELRKQLGTTVPESPFIDICGKSCFS